MRSVKSFVDTEMVRVAKVEGGLTAEEVFQSYLAWARDNNANCEMTQKAFSTICADLNISRDRCSRHIRYALRPAGEVPALAEVA